jgi:hypothetical protein
LKKSDHLKTAHNLTKFAAQKSMHMIGQRDLILHNNSANTDPVKVILDSAHKLRIVAGQGSTVGRRCVESLTKLLPSADAESGAKTTRPILGAPIRCEGYKLFWHLARSSSGVH